jgi:hypothetical protein
MTLDSRHRVLPLDRHLRSMIVFWLVSLYPSAAALRS